MENAELKTYCLNPKICGQYLILQVLKIINSLIDITYIIKVTVIIKVMIVIKVVMIIKIMLTTIMRGRCVR